MSELKEWSTSIHHLMKKQFQPPPSTPDLSVGVAQVPKVSLANNALPSYRSPLDFKLWNLRKVGGDVNAIIIYSKWKFLMF